MFFFLVRLHFSGETTFLELRRRLAMLTKLVANDQEWWYFKPVANGDEEKRLADFKAINSMAKFDEALSANKLLGVALESIVEDGHVLMRIRDSLDELLSGKTKTLIFPMLKLGYLQYNSHSKSHLESLK